MHFPALHSMSSSLARELREDERVILKQQVKQKLLEINSSFSGTIWPIALGH